MDMTAIPAKSENDANEESWELPSSWCWAEIDRVAPVNPSTTFDGLPDDAELPFIPMAAVAEETGLIDLSARRPVSAVAKGYVRFQQGDVLFAKITPCMENGKVAPVPSLAEHFGAGSTEFHVLRPLAVEQRYLWYWLVSRRFRHIAQRNMSGSAGQLRVPTAFLRDSLIPLAPTAEQGRIVERIDSLFTEIAEGEAALMAARKGLETFRRALLKAAVTGELTRDWRENNQPKESGHDLLARIKAERDVISKSGRGKRAAASPPLDTSDLPELPEGWAWARISDVGVVQLGRQRSPQHHQGENMHRYLRVANVFEDRIELGDVKEMNFTPSELETFELRRNDILLNEGQTPDLLGRPAMWRSDERGMCFQNTLLRFRAIEPIEPEFCLLVFRHYLHAKRFKQESQITTNIAHLSSGRFSVIEFPLPPIDEQREIVRRALTALDSTVDAKLVFEQQKADAARLRQAILKYAFEGTLVPQDSSDEPASVMLERLKQSLQTAQAGRRGRKKARHGG